MIDDETAKKFNLFTVIEIVLWTLFAIGLVLSVVGAILIASHFHKVRARIIYVNKFIFIAKTFFCCICVSRKKSYRK